MQHLVKGRRGELSQEGISRRWFLQCLPIAAAAAGMLISGNDEAAARSIEDAPTGNYFESTLTCLARIDRVYRFDHVNYTNGEPWAGQEIQADCTAYDGFGQEFPLHLYYCFNDEKGSDREEAARILAGLLAARRGEFRLSVSGRVAFFGNGDPPTMYDARFRAYRGL